jgi:nitrite reductase/ring-hydroxylating ferredoxin subunit
MDHETLILGRADALAPGDMRDVDVARQKILLVRDGARIRALGAECPHAGAPLAEGKFADGRVIWSWHKAPFCVETGKWVDPPVSSAVLKAASSQEPCSRPRHRKRGYNHADQNGHL